MEHSFCGPVKEKHHFTTRHYLDIGKGVTATLQKYYTSNNKEEPEIFQELYANKELLQTGAKDDAESS